MSLNDSLDAVQRAKLAVWDYPVSNKYTKLWETMQDTGFPDTLEEATKRVISGDFAYIGEKRVFLYYFLSIRNLRNGNSKTCTLNQLISLKQLT